MLGDPPGSEALNLRNTFGELARNVALNCAAQQRDLELDRAGELQPRAVPRRFQQRHATP